jgi:hypothetical protein
VAGSAKLGQEHDVGGDVKTKAQPTGARKSIAQAACAAARPGSAKPKWAGIMQYAYLRQALLVDGGIPYQQFKDTENET